MMNRTPPQGPRVSPRVAAELTGIPWPELDALILRGVIRTERIGGKLFVDLDDAQRAAVEAREGSDAS